MLKFTASDETITFSRRQTGHSLHTNNLNYPCEGTETRAPYFARDIIGNFDFSQTAEVVGCI